MWVLSKICPHISLQAKQDSKRWFHVKVRIRLCSRQKAYFSTQSRIHWLKFQHVFWGFSPPAWHRLFDVIVCNSYLYNNLLDSCWPGPSVNSVLGSLKSQSTVPLPKSAISTHLSHELRQNSRITINSESEIPKQKVLFPLHGKWMPSWYIVGSHFLYELIDTICRSYPCKYVWIQIAFYTTKIIMEIQVAQSVNFTWSWFITMVTFSVLIDKHSHDDNPNIPVPLVFVPQTPGIYQSSIPGSHTANQLSPLQSIDGKYQTTVADWNSFNMFIISPNNYYTLH